MKMLLLLLVLVATVGSVLGPAPGRGPIVVELFTSEGCSNWPAVDAVLRELTRVQSVAGVEVIALGEYVDYWNRLGWKDGFSASAYAARQRQYATGFGSGSYTSQAVVSGRYELVGSRGAEPAAIVAKAAQAPRAVVAVATAGSTAQVRVSSVPAGTAAVEALLVITESGLASQIERGENSGLLLHRAAVVRKLVSLGRVGADGILAANPTFKLPADWKRPNLRVVMMVQEIASWHVVGAGTAPVE